MDLGEWLVANGWAVAYVYFSYEYSRAEQRAKSAPRSIWAGELEFELCETPIGTFPVLLREQFKTTGDGS